MKRRPARSRGAAALVALALLGAVRPLSAVEPATPGSADAKLVEDALSRAVRDAEDDFCRADRLALRPEELRLCPLAEAAASRCPGFRDSCRLARQEKPEDPWNFGFLAQLAPVLRALALALFALLLLGIAAALALLVISVLRARTPSEPDTGAPAPPPRLDVPAELEPSIDRDVERRLRQARAYAAEGAYPNAIAELYAAVILGLDGRGLISARKGRTNGDYARELAPHPELRAAFRDVTRAVEGLHFGGRPVDKSLFERLFARASALVSSTSLLLAFSLLLSLTACDPAGARSPAAQCGTDADGYSFLCSLLERSGSVQRRYRSLTTLSEKPVATLVIVSSLAKDDWESVMRWVEEGGLAVLGSPAGDVDRELRLARKSGPCKRRALVEGFEVAPSALVPAPGPVLDVPDDYVYARCEDGGTYIARLSYGDGTIIVVPSPAALSNASLAAEDNAHVFWPLVSGQRGPVEIVGQWTGSSAQSPFASLRAAGLLPWLAQLALLGLAFALYRGTPFGRRQKLVESSRRSFAEHVQALGDRWADAKASRAALAAYAAWALESLRERTPSLKPAGIAELSETIARRTGSDENAVARTLAKARLAQQAADDGASEAEHLSTLRELGQLLSESGGRR